MGKTTSKKKKLLKRTLWLFVFTFVLMNLVASFHAYKFTHFADNSELKTQSPGKLSMLEKGQTLFFGINNPRPENTIKPDYEFETIKLQSFKKIECWLIKPQAEHHPKQNNGTIIIYHGYGGKKSSMLDKAEEFLKLGYNTFIVDFMGSGGSEGNQTTIGFKESEDVLVTYNYVKEQGEKNIYLFGTSMGAAAIMKAIAEHTISPKAIILECPFGTMYQTVSGRFENMNVPSFPMADLLVFWGGAVNSFWAFDHNPIEYAKNINCPTLLLYGAKDKNVKSFEVEEIFSNLAGHKVMKVYPEAGHDNYLINYKDEWVNDIESFLNN